MDPARTERASIVVRGAVQGVGFRPFVYRHATELRLRGWVLNSAQGVFIEVEGAGDAVREFVHRLETEKPRRAVIRSIECSYLEAAGYERFEIRESNEAGGKSVLIQPDMATCADCAREIFDPADRRFRYPFTNCTNCGPRFSIIESLPYDRANTSMKKFAMCPECAREYHDPLDRRFHAQPIACTRCGPQPELWDADGKVLSRRNDALVEGAGVIRDGSILALKGIGGFQLLVDARSDAAVRRLRERKHREEKPFALMFPSLSVLGEVCEVSAAEEQLLLSAESPIVLLRRLKDAVASISDSVAPNNPFLGAMLPYSPLHHVLMAELGFPIVATSGNLSDEPICIDEYEALERLRGIADFFLVHDRPIVRHMDDSIARMLLGREQVLRRARGYAPFPIHVETALPAILAVGAHIKASVALSVGTEIFISQHIGDLETAAAHAAFRNTAADLPRLYDAVPEAIACDLHPDYLSTQFAARYPAPSFPVQHHFAHVLACMAENDLAPPVLGVSWDGTGYGTDGTVWGGEFLLANGNGFERVAHLRQFRLPGGDAAAKEPRRSALGLLFEIFGDELWDRTDLISAFSKKETRVFKQMLEKQLNAPLTSSAGRLFDAVAALIGLRQASSFEGQAAMELEFAAEPWIADAWPFEIHGPVIDWEPMIKALLRDRGHGATAGALASRFHNTLAEMIAAVARRTGEHTIVLTGGCFQNHYLTIRAVERLSDGGFDVHWHQRVPPNDGGIALGQIMGAAEAIRAAKSESLR
jgi:hydrogenase maturation protein HypF